MLVGMNITKLQFVAVPVADHARAKDFYVNTLGFETVVDHKGPDGQFVMVAPKGAQTGLVLVDFVDSGTVHLQFHSDDVDQDVTELREAGVEVGEPQDMPWGRTARARDLDGNPITLLTPSKLGNIPG
jgi:catechol 2,3-dioxygenase-like lactoylglutathione lyase family enzyme